MLKCANLKNIAGAESPIGGAEISIGVGAEGHPKGMQIDTHVSGYKKLNKLYDRLVCH